MFMELWFIHCTVVHVAHVGSSQVGWLGQCLSPNFWFGSDAYILIPDRVAALF